MTEIKRENSPYGNMKWKLIIHLNGGSQSIKWFKTEREAISEENRYKNRDHEKYCLNINHS